MFSKSRIWHTALGVCLGLLAGQPVMADDTEIFVGHTLDTGEANVLFIIDTSGSMGAKVDWEVPYDPTDTYDGECGSDYIYFVEEDDDYTDVECDKEEYVYESANICEASWTPLAESGFYTDYFAQYKAENEEWKDPDKEKFDWPLECFADNGLHGDGSSIVNVYAAEDDDAPFSSDPDGEDNVDWEKDFDKPTTIYSGNYINYITNPSNYEVNRLDVVKIVARDTLSQVDGLNVGLMRFDSWARGGMVTRAVAPISTEFEPLTTAMDAYYHGGNTPLSETLYEAGRYLMGMSVDYGLDSRGNGGTSEPSVAASRSGNTYISPIQNQCQKNFVVLLTDGAPTGDTGANTKIVSLPGFEEATGVTSCSGNCLDEMASYLHNHDLSSTVDGMQTAETFTIGFHSDQQLLQDTADAGDGTYFTADDVEGLTTAFSEILDTIIERDTSFTAPAIAVNTFNRLTHRDELFLSMFRPTSNPHWEGNVKRYRLDNTDGEKVIYDARDLPAINPVTGTFDIDAKSYWTIGDPDGFDTTLGGFASRLHADRNVYTVTSGATSNVVLSDAANRVHEDNSALTETLLDVAPADRAELLRWARGVDALGQPLKILGDALHSRPVVLSWGGSEADPDITLFYSTNDGYFHAVDPTVGPSDPMEIFSFIPQELLPELQVLRANDRNNPPKFYGLDGQISFLIHGDDGDRVIESGERAFIYLGMRRGGDNYYAIEVTDRDNPKLAWTIRGGQGQFTELGQTWSELTPARVNVGGTVRDVLMFGGGYDTGQDAAGPNVADDVGRAIYMVDALTGSLIWWAANSADNAGADLRLSDMTNSIPSDLRIIDINGDHVHDRIYVGDTTGQMWRFDIHNDTANGTSDLITGGVIADIGGDDAAGNRRIFYPPSVSLYADEWLGSFLAVSFGTGHRANPLGTEGKTVSDRFYMLRDPYVVATPVDSMGDPTYVAATDADFYDVTTDLQPSVAQLNSHKGWSITLDHEEKVLAKSLTADGRIFFTSYLKDAPGQLACSPTAALGGARAYSVAIGTGGPVVIGDPDDPDTPENPECSGRCTPTQGPIPPEPVLVFTEPPEQEPCDPAQETCPDDDDDDTCDGIADAALMIGTDVLDPAICTAPVRTYWFADGDT